MTFFPMIRLVLRNLLTPPATRRYPKKVRAPFPASRGKIVIDFASCVFCGACAKHCPAGSIATDRNSKSWSIDRFSCVTCAACVRACPKKCLSMDPARPVSALFADGPARIDSHVLLGASDA